MTLLVLWIWTCSEEPEVDYSLFLQFRAGVKDVVSEEGSNRSQNLKRTRRRSPAAIIFVNESRLSVLIRFVWSQNVF